MSKILEAVRAKYPAYDTVPDDELVLAIGDKYPVYLKQDRAFQAEHNRLALQREKRQAGEAVVNAAIAKGDSEEPGAATEIPLGAVGHPGAAMGAGGKLLAAKVADVGLGIGGQPTDENSRAAAEDPLAQPLPLEQQLTDLKSVPASVAKGMLSVPRTLPAMAAGTLMAPALTPYVSYPLAFGTQTHGETEGDVKQTAKSVAIAAVFPVVGKLMQPVAAGIGAQLVDAGLINAANTTGQKAVEAVINQAAFQAVAQLAELPAYAEMTPEERLLHFAETTAANTVFALPDAIGVARSSVPSATAARVHELALESARKFYVDEAARAALDPRQAQVKAGEVKEYFANDQARFAPKDKPVAEEVQTSVKPAPEPLTAPAASEKVAVPELGAETITGPATIPEERTGSAMPAEREERLQPNSGVSIPPKKPAVKRPMDRPWDLIDEVQATVGGKISLAKTRELIEGFKPTGALRKLFSNNPDAFAPDIVAQAVEHMGKFDSDGGFIEALEAAAAARKGNQSAKSYQNKLLKVEAKQSVEFSKRVLAGERPKKDAGKVEQVAVQELLEGDTFEAQGHKFKVKELELSEDGELMSLTVEDGPKFGVQRLEPGVDVIHIDKGTLKNKAVPAGEDQPFDPSPREENLFSAPESVEQQQQRTAREQSEAQKRAQREELAKRQAKPLVGSRGDIGQRDMFGGGDLFADPAMPAAPAGTPMARVNDARMLVAMEPIVPGQVSIPQVMKSLENVIVAAGGTAPIRTGRMGAAARSARGIFKVMPEVVRLNSADNIPTGTHEVAHAVAKAVWGDAGAKSFQSLDPKIKAELVKLGRALYGPRVPTAGYTGEGWAEFVRTWLTTEDAVKLAPATSKWFETEVLAKHPELGKALTAARDQIDIWRGQGAQGRANAQMQEGPGKLERLKAVVEKSLGSKAQLEELEPLAVLSRGFKETKGARLPLEQDPYLIATAKRGTAGKVLENMVDREMQDIWGRPTGAPALREALAPVKAHEARDFAQYLWARRALERWAQNKNPGMTREDARYLKTKLETPAFAIAADNYYKWWDGVMDYLAESSPANAELVKVIRKNSHDYVPLARIIDDTAKMSAAGMPSNPLKRMHGSGRPIKEIYQQSLLNAQQVIARAHKDLVLESVYKLSRHEGMGWLVEEVPKTLVQERVNVEKIREQLEAMGVDTTAVPADELLSYWTPSDAPKGVDPIMVRRLPNGETKWYQVPKEVYESLAGLDNPRLGAVADFFGGMPARAFKLGTTGLRASFSLVTNPLRDFQTFMAQSVADTNPAARAGAYFTALFDVVRAGLGGKESPSVKLFNELGVQGGQWLGGDIGHVKREAKALFHGRMMRKVTAPVETLRELLSITEAAPRLAEMNLVGKDHGWKPGQPVTPAQAIAMTIAAKRVTTDFSAGGSVGKMVNQVIPFYNAVIQGTRGFARAFKGDQDIGKVRTPGAAAARTVLYGLGMFTLPALALWWANKDKEWYKNLTWRERYLYTNVEGENGVVYQIPRPAEWGNAFMVAPEALADLWYRKDPKGAFEAMRHMFETQNPVDYPVLGRIAKEQWQNRIEFFDRPIVPRNQIDLPPGDQRGPYTTKLGEWIGDAFPEHASPRRIDAAVRGFFGGAVPDLMDAVGLGSAKATRDKEAADFPIYGRLARRGGQFSAASQPISDYYDDLQRYGARYQAMQQALRAGKQPAKPMTGRELAYFAMLQGYSQTFHYGHEIADRTTNQLARQRIYQSMARDARRITAGRPQE